MKKLTPYRQVAKEALKSWNGLSEDEAEKKVESESFEELENQVWATGSMSYAIEAIASKTNIDKEELEKAVFNVKKVTVDKASQEVFDKIKAQSEKLGGEKGIIEILSAIHDGWVKDNVKKFNQEGREAKRYQHLPIELIGWKEAKADLLFLNPILAEIMPEQVDMKALEEQYYQVVRNFLQEKEISTREDLANAIMSGKEFYDVLSEKNTAPSIEIAESMADKVLEVNSAVVLEFEDEQF